MRIRAAVLKVLTDEDMEQLNGAVDGMMRVLHEEPFNDQFSNFYNPELYADLQAQTTGEYAGVGILMGISPDGMYPEVVTVFDKTPAREADVREGDIIVKVDEDDTGMILPQVARRSRVSRGQPWPWRLLADETIFSTSPWSGVSSSSARSRVPRCLRLSRRCRDQQFCRRYRPTPRGSDP
jgi:C-terminal processing protease CtpA/Prc